ncbi:MAG: hypothetical protein KDD40_12985, partial [Bdellovibrionales bacterium]|nr:hypothetical protein [Bdellovibrionales bacterium]
MAPFLYNLPMFRVLSLFILIFCGAGWSSVSIKKIYILGDSLTEGYGIASDQAYPQKLDKQIQAKFPNKYKVIGAGVSGSTTASGLKRLQWLMRAKPFLVIIALGANDGLRGFDVKATQENLEKMIVYLKKNSVKVVLAGMKVPPNYGQEYRVQF